MESRREFLQWLAATAALALHGCDRKEKAMTAVKERMPVVFVGHGSPMNVIEDNRWSRGFAALRDKVPTPKAILAISAHWFVDATLITSNAHPKTIHDFGGFPKALYEVEYPAPGNLDLAQRVRGLLSQSHAALSEQWGLDHGTWSVLHWMYPGATVPVIQLSINRRLSMREHYEIGRSLSALRDEGVLIFGSGNVTHNLRDAMQRMQTRATDTPEWARRFDETVKDATLQHDTNTLLGMWPSDDGRMAHPSPDHWLPLLYVYGASDERDRVQFPLEGFDLGSLSMRNIVFG